MPKLDCNEILLARLQEIDQKHKYLVRLLAEAYEEFAMGINIETGFLDNLFNCMANCFDCEEALMLEASYPSFLEHKSEHDQFILKFIQIYKYYKQDADTSVSILLLLNKLINHHMREMDCKYKAFVNKEAASCSQ